MNENVLYQNKFFRVCQEGRYFVIRERAEKNGVVVLVSDQEGRFLLVGLDRPAVGKKMFEFPRGAIDNGETALQAGVREVREETGLQCREAVSLGIVHSNSSLIASHVEIIHATLGCDPVSERDGEVDEVFWLRPDQIGQWIRAGKITDGHSLSAWALLAIR